MTKRSQPRGPWPIAPNPATLLAMSTQRLGADLQVGAFGLLIDGATRRLDFPRGELDNLRGTAGDVEYGAREVVFDKLHTRLDRTHWQAEAASGGGLFLRLPGGALELGIGRLEMTHGVVITRAAEGGVEILAPHASLQDVVLQIPELSALRGSRGAEVAATALRLAADVPLRQDKLRWLDTLAGEIRMTVKVVLDLPVLGTRTLDQTLKMPIKDGSLDYRALEDSLDWLEGAFLDLGVKDGRLVLSWKVPVFGRSRELISFELDEEARTLATFDRVPLRSFADFRLPRTERELAAAAAAAAGQPAPEPDKKKKGVLRSLTLQGFEVDLAMHAPRSVEIGAGAIQFGGEDDPGLVGLKLAGSLVHPPGPGGLTGSIGVLDITAKDLAMGSAHVTCDRLHLDGVDSIEVGFDGFQPIGLTATIHRITASNLSLRVGGAPSGSGQ